MRKISLFIHVCLLLLAWSVLSATGIGLVSESLPALGNVDGFTMYGSYALFSNGEHDLQLMDLQDKDHPRVIGWLDLPEDPAVIKSINLYQDKAYLYYVTSCAVVSLSDPSQPVLLNTFGLGADLSCMTMRDGILYTGHYQEPESNYILSHSLADPLHPVLLDSLTTNCYMRSMVTGDGFLVIEDDWYGFLVIDSSDPGNLGLRGRIDEGTMRWAVGGKYFVYEGEYSLHIYDLTLSYESYETIQIPGSQALDICVGEDGRAWVLYYSWNEQYGIQGIDLGDPLGPVQIYSELVPDYYCRTLMVSQNWLATKGERGSIYFADLAESPLPDFRTSHPLGSLVAFCKEGELMAGITSGGNGELMLLSHAPDGSLCWGRKLNLEYPNHPVIHNGLLLATSINSLFIFDPQSGETISALSLGTLEWFISQIVPVGNLVVVCGGVGSYSWYIVDIQDPQNPLLIYQNSTDGLDFRSAVVEGNRVWLASKWTLHCYDILSPSSPVKLYDYMIYDEPNFRSPHRIIKRGNYIYALVSMDNLGCFRLGELGVEEASWQRLRYDSISLLQFGEGLICTDTYGLSVLSLEDPMHPLELAWEQVPEVGTTSQSYESCVLEGTLIKLAVGNSLLTYDGELAYLLTRTQEPVAESELLIYPNPAPQGARIVCKAATAGDAKLEVFNLRGQMVNSKSIAIPYEGYNLLHLDLTDRDGRNLASGVYWVRLEESGKKRVARLVVIK